MAAATTLKLPERLTARLATLAEAEGKKAVRSKPAKAAKRR